MYTREQMIQIVKDAKVEDCAFSAGDRRYYTAIRRKTTSGSSVSTCAEKDKAEAENRIDREQHRKLSDSGEFDYGLVYDTALGLVVYEQGVA
jgi:hypothetical protein